MLPEKLNSSENSQLVIAKTLFDAGCVLVDFEKPVTSSSGIQSPIKVDCEKLTEFPFYFKSVVAGLASVVHSNYLDFDYFCGVIKGGVPFSRSLGERFSKPSIARLGKRQDGERRKLFSGEISPNSQVLIIEDVVTKGEKVVLVGEQIRIGGSHVLGVMAIFNYCFKEAAENLVNNGLRFWSLTNFRQLLEIGQETGALKISVIEKLEEWWKKTNLQILPR